MAARTRGHTTAETVGTIGEFALIERISRALRPSGERVVTGIGDDTAVLDTGGPRLLLATVDMQVEGRHFIRRRTPPELLGRRVGAVNLSDVGAMGGEPRWALVSLALPRALPVSWVDRFYQGLDEILGEFGATVVGGNLSGGPRVIADLTLLGEVERDRVVRRSGARPGDLLCVTGTLGRSAAGRAALDAGLGDPTHDGAVRAHLAPWPRVREGRALAATGVVRAMMDLSDGLGGDLRHICDASGVGASVWVDRLPIAEDTRSIAARLGLDPIDLALGGGEDFELLFAVAPGEEAAAREAAGEIGLTVIGEVRRAVDEVRFVGLDGVEYRAEGWDHFRGTALTPGPSPVATGEGGATGA